MGTTRTGKHRCPIIKLRQPFGRGVIRHMYDQRIEIGPPLGAIDLGHRFGIRRVSRKPIYRFGRNRDNIAHPQPLHRLRNCSGFGLRYPAMS